MAETPGTFERVLLLTDDPILRAKVTAHPGRAVDWVVVRTLREARQQILDGRIDALVVQPDLPDATGLEPVVVLAAALPRAPMVVIGDPDRLAAVEEGADAVIRPDDADVEHLLRTLLSGWARRGGSAPDWRSRLEASPRRGDLAAVAEAPAVVLDGAGRIVRVNEAWEARAAAQGLDPDAVAVGADYLAVCDAATGEGAEGATEIGEGIRAVLTGAAAAFDHDYPCWAEEGLRWFTVRVRPTGELGGGAVVTHHDVTGSRLVEERNRRLRDPYQALIEDESPIFVLVAEGGTVEHISAVAARMLRIEPEHVVGRNLFEVLDRGEAARLHAAFSELLSGRRARRHLTLRVVDGIGAWHHLDLVAVDMTADPAVGAIALVGTDVTAAKRQTITAAIESRLLRCLPAAVVVTDDLGVVVYWNDMAERLFGVPADAAIGRPAAEVNPGLAGDAVDEAIAQVRATGCWEGDLEALGTDGRATPIYVRLERVTAEHVGFTGLVGTSIDITDRRRLEERLEHQALHDHLTGLANRDAVVDHLGHLLGTPAGRTAVLVVDLDDFRSVNDQVGAEVGDRVLQAVGALMSAVVDEHALVGRIGGDEFVVCLPAVERPADALAVADRLVTALSAPLGGSGRAVALSASIGVALSWPTADAEALLRSANRAMYEAKEGGKRRVVLFDDALRAAGRATQQMADELRRALREGEIVPYFQPEVDLSSGELLGFEALARWKHPAEGMVPPDRFITVAERSGLIGRLGHTMLMAACERLAAWNAGRSRHLTMAVNVSAVQLVSDDFARHVLDVIDASGVDPSCVCIELTESTIASATRIAEVLADLRAGQVTLAIDDFGTGYSSLSRLSRLPVQFLKIDRSFVASMIDDPASATIVSTVIGMADALGLETIAEGVETPAQAVALAAAGCHTGQGYLWSPPVDGGEIDGWLSTRGTDPVIIDHKAD